MSGLSGKSNTQGASNAGWMLTFADLLSLLLTFFVLVFSMSTLQFDSWKDVVKTMRDEFNPNYSAITLREFENTQPVARRANRGLNLNYLKVLVERDLSRIPGLASAMVQREADRVVISLPASSLFEPKSGQFVEGAPSLLAQMAGSLLQIKNKLLIAGHTNDLPVTNGLFRSNWELSVTRAQLVSGVLVDAGYFQPITVVGHGDSKFARRNADRVTVEQLTSQERIDFVILGESRANGALNVF